MPKYYKWSKGLRNPETGRAVGHEGPGVINLYYCTSDGDTLSFEYAGKVKGDRTYLARGWLDGASKAAVAVAGE